MKPIVEMTCNYIELVESFEFEIIADAHTDDYQGDSLYLLKDGARIGLLEFGWGSCSGCDALQSCGSVEEVVALRDELYRNIKWQPGLTEMLAVVGSKDWEASVFDEKLREDFAKSIAEYQAKTAEMGVK